MILQTGVILAKGQLDHSDNFLTMSILILSSVQIIMGHPLDTGLFYSYKDEVSTYANTYYACFLRKSSKALQM